MNLMRLLIFSLLVLPFYSFAQDKAAIDELYNQYSRREGCSAMSINHSLLKMIDIEMDWQDEIEGLVGELREIRFIFFSGREDGRKLIQSMRKKILAAGYPAIDLDEELSEMQFSEIYAHPKKGKFTEAQALFMDDDGKVYFFSFRGDFTIRKHDKKH